MDRIITNNKGEMSIENIAVDKLVADYGSPLVVISENKFKSIVGEYKENFYNKDIDVKIMYASKAFIAPKILEIVKAEGLGLDVVSGAELYTALKSDFPKKDIIFHGNNKTYDELELALQENIGRIVVDNFAELENLEILKDKITEKQDVFLRITPGVEAHTHEFIKTGSIDSKFGFTLSNGDALEGVKKALANNKLNVVGLHCHIGSQIFNMTSFKDSVEIMMNFIADIKRETGLEIKELDMGGGFGIAYTKDDDISTIKEYANNLFSGLKESAEKLNINIPKLLLEPGRSLIGPSAVNIYTVGTIKKIEGVRTYVAVDGGMSDNIRPALYDAIYDISVDGKNIDDGENEVVTIVGKCCESGDILRKDVLLPKLNKGDRLIFHATGAYGYSMASNYNLIGRPRVIMVDGDKVKEVIKRETYEDIVSLFNF